MIEKQHRSETPVARFALRETEPTLCGGLRLVELPPLFSCVKTDPIVSESWINRRPPLVGKNLITSSAEVGKLYQTCLVIGVASDGIPPRECISIHTACEKLLVGNLSPAQQSRAISLRERIDGDQLSGNDSERGKQNSHDLV